MSADQPYSSAFQSTPPARGATTRRPPPARLPPDFNPRPPRGGRLLVVDGQQHALLDFNPRPPRGGRLCAAISLTPQTEFQSTPPARGATTDVWRFPITNTAISIHAPREGGDPFRFARAAERRISIHAPREGGDFCTPVYEIWLSISIHAPREGGDATITAAR